MTRGNVRNVFTETEGHTPTVVEREAKRLGETSSGKFDSDPSDGEVRFSPRERKDPII